MAQYIQDVPFLNPRAHDIFDHIQNRSLSDYLLHNIDTEHESILFVIVLFYL